MRVFSPLLLLLALVALPPGPGRTGESCWPGAPGSDPDLCPPNDPGYPRRWEFRSDIPEGIDRDKLHPAELALGSIGISLDTAWQQTIGRPDVVIAVLDSGIRWADTDLVNKLYVNPGELPPPEGAEDHDGNGDGLVNIEDYAADPRVGDRNENGILDPEDLILAFSDCRDDDGNGYPDDISGYDFFGGSHCGFAAGDNNPRDATDFGHGTGIASTAAAEADNGRGVPGVCPRCRVLPVRVGDSFVVDANRFARGVVFATRAGAAVIASALGSYNNTPAARFAVDFAYRNGVPIIASAADEYSYHHNYPSLYNHTLYVNAIRFNHAKDPNKASTFWGLNPCTNFGARVWVTVPAESCSSGATSRLAGVAGLVVSMAREAGIDDLHAEEVYQVLRATADDLDNLSPDWNGLRYPARPGFDQLYGYGRVHARRAVTAVAEGRIPPVAELAGPRWFAVVSPRATPLLSVRGSIGLPRASRGRFRLEYALGVEPQEADYRTVASGTVSGRRSGVLGTLDFRRLPLPGGPAPKDRDERDRYSVTLRLRVTDDRGRTAEARRSFFVFDDPAWKPHFPLDVGASGEASPLLVDLDGDGRDEIILAGADGRVRRVEWHASGLRETRMELETIPPIDPLADPSRQRFREPVPAAPATGDLTGSGRPAIVVASREGKVYAFDPRGERLGGFPVSIDPERSRPATPARRVEPGILSRPVLADLDGRPGAEILVSAMDGHLYAWRHDGRPLAGFPVRVSAGARIVSTPAVGDIDGDGRPEIVVGSNGVREGLSAAYAIRAAGNADPRGAHLEGWPIELPAIRPRLLPTLGKGVSMDPVLVDVDGDGDDEAVLYAVAGNTIALVDHLAGEGPRAIRHFSLEPDAASGFHGMTFLTSTGSPLIRDTDSDGRAELYVPLLSFRMLTLRAKPGVPLDVPLGLGGWELAGVPPSGGRTAMMPGFPRRMEDLTVRGRPAAGDVDGDGVEEILMGSGGYLLHAFRKRGGEAAGFPKFTGGWIYSEPAVGDLDGDGRAEVVAVTREGYLFAWEVEPPVAGGARPMTRYPPSTAK